MEGQLTAWNRRVILQRRLVLLRHLRSWIRAWRRKVYLQQGQLLRRSGQAQCSIGKRHTGQLNRKLHVFWRMAERSSQWHWIIKMERRYIIQRRLLEWLQTRKRVLQISRRLHLRRLLQTGHVPRLRKDDTAKRRVRWVVRAGKNVRTRHLHMEGSIHLLRIVQKQQKTWKRKVHLCRWEVV